MKVAGYINAGGEEFMIIAENVALYWYEGVDFRYPIEFEDEDTGDPIDVTGWSFKSEIRRSDGTLVIELSSANGRITIEDAVEGEILLHATPAQMAGVEVDAAGETWCIDVVAKDAAGVKSRVISGTVEASPQNTDASDL